MTHRGLGVVVSVVAILVGTQLAGCIGKGTGATQTELTVTGSTTILPIAETAVKTSIPSIRTSGSSSPVSGRRRASSRSRTGRVTSAPPHGT